MAVEWRTGTLGDIADLVMGQSPTGDTCNEVGRGVPLLNGPTEFGGNHPRPVQFTTDPRKFAESGDLLFCVRGSTTGRMNWADQRYAIGRGLAAIRAKAGKEYRHFVRAVIDANLSRLLASATGSTFPNVSRNQIQEIKCAIPPLTEQKAIAAVLGALDDKIELNRRMNATLEAMARALFDNWIGSHANDIEESVVQQLLDNNVLLIGDGYRAKNSEFADDGLPFIRAGNLKVDGLDLAGAEILSARSTAAAGHKVGKVDDVAFTSKGTVGRITRVSPKTGPFVYSPQVCFWRCITHDILNPNVLYRWMSSDDFTRQVTAVSTQTDMAPYVSLQDQKKMVIQLPPPTAQSEIAKQLQPIDTRIAANSEQSRTLATLRDTLLPKLLSGEIRPSGK